MAGFLSELATHPLPPVKRIKPFAVDFLDLVPPDFQTRRQLFIFNRERLIGEDHAADFFGD
jgi:hypothetical protein